MMTFSDNESSSPSPILLSPRAKDPPEFASPAADLGVNLLLQDKMMCPHQEFEFSVAFCIPCEKKQLYEKVDCVMHFRGVHIVCALQCR